jgi:hypothetical protein
VAGARTRRRIIVLVALAVAVLAAAGGVVWFQPQKLDGRRFLRLAELRTSNGPDLFVYLSAAAADAPLDSFDDDFVALGRLKGNQGNQNYLIPAGVDLTRYSTAVIWCRRFTYAFGAAPLR